MPNWTIYADEIHEGDWFKGLHPNLARAAELEMTGAVALNPRLGGVLLYDRPDIVLADGDEPVLVLERTIEVPSGHNVGQRFARLAASGEARVPVVYFGPYAARKHGGLTAGPRYMNLRLFAALDKVARVNNCAVTCINWPVDERFEIIRDHRKDERVREYLELFFRAYCDRPRDVNETIMQSQFEAEQLEERRRFAAGLRRAGHYNEPPKSVTIVAGSEAARTIGSGMLAQYDEVVLYSVGMKSIRADPYTGMAMLYRYLYVLGESSRLYRALVLCFPHITADAWRAAAGSDVRKDIRLFRMFADGILFKNDVFLTHDEL